MNPADIRDAVWEELRDKLAGARAEVYRALGQHAPATVRRLAEAMGWDVLSVAPRICELAEVGLVALCGMEGRRGMYETVEFTQAVADRVKKRTAQDEQMLLPV